MNTASPLRRVALDNRGRQVWADAAPSAPAPAPTRLIVQEVLRRQNAANPYRAPCGRLRIGPEDVS